MATTVTRTNGRNPNPFIKKAQAAGKAPGQPGAAPDGIVAPDEVAAIRASISSREQAPSVQQQTTIIDWRDVADRLGDPFSVEQIPLSKLRMMRRDPIIGFALSFIKTPHIRARWYIDAKDVNGPNAQVAAHLDHDLRLIISSLVAQWMNSLDFGFQSIAKRFEFGIPAGTYVAQDANGQMTDQPIWSQGNIQPIRWKPFVALPPETVNPNWGGDGSFSGINYDGSKSAPAGGTGATPAGNDKFDIDLYHSLWVTNERDPNFGNIFGYPRLGYAYKFWWSFWFRWSIADRAFEKKADPSILIYHPQGSFTDPVTGLETSYADYALNMGYRMRSGGVMTLPSMPYEGPNGPTNIREWEIDFTKDMVNFDPFDKSFDYLDIGKIRALWIPEQALVEGRGGTSSRNVAAEFDSSFTESQAVMSVQIAETINRWVIPQWLAANYPEFIANNGTAMIVIQGFADEDVAFTQQIIQLIGQQEVGISKLITMVDLHKVLDDAGVPLLDVNAQNQEMQKLIAVNQSQSSPNPVTPVGGPNGTVGVQPASVSGSSSLTGFSHKYIQPREVIYLTRKDVYGDEEEVDIKIKRVPDNDDGVIARFDPEDQTVYLSESASIEDTNKYMAAVGQALVK